VARLPRPAGTERHAVKFLLVLLLVCLPSAVFAQQPVTRWADWTSYGTAAVNPTLAAWDARHSRCKLARFGLSEGIGNGLTLALKHRVISARPCLGCAPDGFPSGHTMNSLIGFSRNWKVGLAFGLATAELRVTANRHTWQQVLAGAGVAVAAEASGYMIRCQE
jgi:membrane-associated phospholipid phosphatase